MSHPTEPTDVGKNQTGIATAPVRARETVEGAEQGSPGGGLDGAEIARVRLELSRDVPPVGTMPPPASLKGMAKTALDILKGKPPLVLLDKLAERLAFERTGTRIYEALLVKFDASHNPDPAITREQIEQIRDDEHRHVDILRSAIEAMGADPTVMTPCADLTGVATLGVVQVLSDPRTTFTQALNTILIAELADNDGWWMLSDLATKMGHTQLAADCREAFAQEQRHLVRVRDWLVRSISAQSGVSEQPGAPAP